MNVETETMAPDETQEKIVARITNMGKKVARQATEVAHESLDTVRAKTGAVVHHSQDYVREHTLPVLLGTLAVGFAAGYLVALLEGPPRTRRRYILDTPIRYPRNFTPNRMGNYLKFW